MVWQALLSQGLSNRGNSQSVQQAQAQRGQVNQGFIRQGNQPAQNAQAAFAQGGFQPQPFSQGGRTALPSTAGGIAPPPNYAPPTTGFQQGATGPVGGGGFQSAGGRDVSNRSTWYDNRLDQRVDELNSAGDPFGALLGDVYSQDPNQIPDFLERQGPLLAYALTQSDQFRNAQNFDQYINPDRDFASGAARIAQGQQEGLTQAQNQLARSGLGRSAANAGLANQAALASAGSQGDLLAGLQQSADEQRYAGSLNNFGMLQDVISLMLGQAPTSNRLLRYSQPQTPKESEIVSQRFLGNQIAGII